MATVQSRRRFVTNAAWRRSRGSRWVWCCRARWPAEHRLPRSPHRKSSTICFEKDPVTCIAPQVVQELLRAEGFTDIRYVELTEANSRVSA